MTDRRPSRFASREILSLFPTMLFGAPVGDGLPALAATARARLTGSGPGRRSPPDLHRDPAFAGLAAALTRGARQALDELGYLKTVRPQLGALWATAAPAQRAEPLVQAGNAFFAGLLVLEAPGEPVLRAADPRPQALVLQPAVSETNALNATEVLLPLPLGRALLFPGWLAHGLAPSAAPGERLVLRFSLLFENMVAELSPPNWDHPHGKRMAP
jgi:hypothetical protein